MTARVPKPGRRRAATAFLIAAVALACAPLSADEIPGLARQLTQMRGEVETLASELDLQKRSLRNDLDSLAAQKAEVEAEIEKERIRIRELDAALSREREKIDSQSVSGDDLKPIVTAAIEAGRGYVRASLPYRVPERLAELDDLAEKLDSGAFSPEKVATMLWAFFEDELRLTRESGLDRQIVVVDGAEQLADVARVGMVMLFFKTAGGRFGAAARSADGWRYEVLAGSEDAKRVALLFDSFKKQVRVGYFELPDALPAQEGTR